VLHRSQREPGFLEQRIRFGRQDPVSHSPVAEQHLADDLTVAEAFTGSQTSHGNPGTGQAPAPKRLWPQGN
jgi:beta-lactamase class A